MNAARCTYNVCRRYISQRITRLVSAAAAAAAAESRGGTLYSRFIRGGQFFPVYTYLHAIFASPSPVKRWFLI